jgi:hypothetical protein
MNTVRRAECARRREYLRKALWKSHEQTGDEAVNDFPSEGTEAAALRPCELRVNLCEMLGYR